MNDYLPELRGQDYDMVVCNEEDFSRLAKEIGACSFITNTRKDQDGTVKGTGTAHHKNDHVALRAVIDSRAGDMGQMAISEIGRRYQTTKGNPFLRERVVNQRTDQEFLSMERFYANVYYPDGLDVSNGAFHTDVYGSSVERKYVEISYETVPIKYETFEAWVRSGWDNVIIEDQVRQFVCDRGSVFSRRKSQLVEVLNVFSRTEVPF